MSVFISVPHCLDYCFFTVVLFFSVVSFEIGKYISQLVFLFHCFGYSEFLDF